MVGDRAADVLTAKANNIKSIGALWGYGSMAELSQAGVDMLSVTPKDLPPCIWKVRRR